MGYSFSYLEPVHCSMSGSNCCFLTCIQISQEADQVVWYSHLLKNFPQFIVIHTVKGFDVVNEAEVDVFSGIILLFLWSSTCWEFDLWFLCLFWNQLEHLEVLGSCTSLELTQMRSFIWLSNGSSKKQETSRKTSISALLTMPKPLMVWIIINCGKFWKRWE